MTSVPSNVYVVLCHPADVRNVAGAIRAVVNAGLAGIRIVTRTPFDERDILCYSSSASEVTQIDFFETVDEAVADCSGVVGTSRRLRDPDAPPEWPAAGLAARLSRQGRTAILFGCERTGLTKHELALCSAVVHIPTTEAFPSMNLAHAVACIGYELSRPDPNLVGPAGIEEPPRLPAAARSAFYRKVTEICCALDYPPGRNPEAFVQRLRKIFHRANLNQQELNLLGGVFSEMMRLGRLAGDVGSRETPSKSQDDGGDDGRDRHDDDQ